MSKITNLETTKIIVIIFGVAAITLVGVQQAEAQTEVQEQAQYAAKLAYCYDLLEDISNDFGWFFQAQKRVTYNEGCGELTGYITPEG